MEKKKHNKRRIIQEYSVEIFLKKLELNGFLHIITDCNLYKKHILKTLKKNFNFLEIKKNSSKYVKNLKNLKLKKTKFEKKEKNPNKKNELIFQKILNN